MDYYLIGLGLVSMGLFAWNCLLSQRIDKLEKKCED